MVLAMLGVASCIGLVRTRDFSTSDIRMDGIDVRLSPNASVEAARDWFVFVEQVRTDASVLSVRVTASNRSASPVLLRIADGKGRSETSECTPQNAVCHFGVDLSPAPLSKGVTVQRVDRAGRALSPAVSVTFRRQDVFSTRLGDALEGV